MMTLALMNLSQWLTFHFQVHPPCEVLTASVKKLHHTRLAISFALPTLGQQTNTPDPQLRQQILVFVEKFDPAFNSNGPASLASFYTEDAVLVVPEGPQYGREAIAKFWADLFGKVRFSNHLGSLDQYSPHMIGTSGNEMWATGGWSQTVEGLNLGMKGYWSGIVVREGDAWKFRLHAITPPPPPPPEPAPHSVDPQLRQVIDAQGAKSDEAFNNGDAAAAAALFTEDAVLVTDTGPIYGRKAIEKYHADLFQKVHFSNHRGTADQDSPHTLGTAGNEMWETGSWTTTIRGQNFGPIELKGFWASIMVREGDAWKYRMNIWNITPPAQTK